MDRETKSHIHRKEIEGEEIKSGIEGGKERGLERDEGGDIGRERRSDISRESEGERGAEREKNIKG